MGGRICQREFFGGGEAAMGWEAGRKLGDGGRFRF
jgi:hypothetical protein